MQRRLVGYVRIAPREHPRRRPGLDEQRLALEAHAARHGWTVVGWEHDVRSGRTLRRAGLQAALAACRAGKADGIAVARLDRLTYSLADLAQLVREADDDGFTIVAAEPALDLAAPEGRAVREVLAVASTWRPRSLVGRPRGRAAGRRPGRPVSTPPDVAARIRALRAQGATLQAICDRLNGEQVPTPRGGARWRPSSLRAILRSTKGGSA